MRLLVTAGPTREWLDPVRFISNASSGRMGYTIAREAIRCGHEVILVSGPVALRPPRRAKIVPVETALQMLQGVMEHIDEVDALVKTAAVADYRPANTSPTKMKRRKSPLILKLLPNPDILAEAAKRKKPHQIFVGFALEDSINAIDAARRKMAAKKLDLIVLNAPQSIGADRSQFVLLHRSGRVETLSCRKQSLARRIIRIIEELRSDEPA